MPFRPFVSPHEHGKVILKDVAKVERFEALAQAIAPLVVEWRAMPKFADAVWQMRQAVVLAFDALAISGDTTSGPPPGPASPDLKMIELDPCWHVKCRNCSDVIKQAKAYLVLGYFWCDKCAPLAHSDECEKTSESKT
jgi:hypothetical protein